MTQLAQLPSFSHLTSLAVRLQTCRIDTMLGADAGRGKDFSAMAAGLTLDYSRQLVDREVMSGLWQLGNEAQLGERAKALLGGNTLNTTEQRPALHSLLRANGLPPGNSSLAEKYAAVVACRARMATWANRVNGGEHLGYTGEPITDVVNIGIGGSDLGPRLVTEALTPYSGAISCHYVANVDPTDLENVLRSLNPAKTLFIVCSKSFGTQETLANAHSARTWLLDAGASSSDLKKHFVATTTNLKAAAAFGIVPDNCLPLWDWVGGRYSVWSAVGLSCAIAVGWENFQRFLTGARQMDDHFASAGIEQNLPMLMSLLEVWNTNFLGAGNHVVLPYAQHLQHLPDFLQQLTLESNGKRVDATGNVLSSQSAPVLWGSAGTMGQHSFHQMLHQGTRLCPVDFILPLTTAAANAGQHRILVANCLAQGRAFMVGRREETAFSDLLARGTGEAEARRLAPHLVIPGNRPTSTISMDALTPEGLGALLALYEHRTFCSGQLWGVNSFDQWGVELGKEIGNEILAVLSGAPPTADLDSATTRLIDRWRTLHDEAGQDT